MHTRIWKQLFDAKAWRNENVCIANANLRIGTCLHHRLWRIWTVEDNACRLEDEVVPRADCVPFFETQSLFVQIWQAHHGQPS
jgi:hypothetical protein